MSREEGARSAWNWRRGSDPAVAVLRRRRARRRGLVQALAAATVGAGLFLYLTPLAAAVVWTLAGLMALAAVLSPEGALAAIERGLLAFGHGVGTVVTWALLVPLYYLVFTPLGLLLKRGRRDPMARRLDRRAASYWIERGGEPPSPQSYERQY